MKAKLIVVISLAVVLGMGLAVASENERGERGEYSKSYSDNRSSGLDASYVKECSDCHIAYPASMLPARSWDKMMSTLDDHFGENAELDAAMTQQLRDYLMANAGGSKLLRRLDRNDTPLRISELPYFKKEHNEMPKRVLQDERIGSLSNCQNCHQKAEQGSFRERDINIPGYGRWED